MAEDGSPVLSDAFANVAIAVNIHREKRKQLSECLFRVKMNLPGASLQVFGNDSETELIEVCHEMCVPVIEGRNYGNNRYWYLWWRRMLEWFVASGRAVLLKLDPDTMVDRPPAFIPDADYFGCIDDWFIQGGCTGISRRLALRLLETQMLTVGNARRVHVTHKAFADDKYLARMIIDMGITPFAWSEVKSQWRQPVPNEDHRFAIVHPRYHEG